MNHSPHKTKPTRRQLLQQSSLLTAAACLPTLPLLAQPKPPPKDQRIMRYTNPKTYNITHSIDITNGDFNLVSLEIWLPVPQDHPEQKITNLNITPKVPILIDKTTNVKIARLYQKKSEAPRPDESQSFGLQYQLTTHESHADPDKLNAVKHQPYKQDRHYRTYIRPEKRLQTHHSKIRQLAAKFKGNKRSPVHTARLIYDFVIENTTYKLMNGQPGSAAYCLNHKHGECTEYTALFVALCRAARIPARPVSGCWADLKNHWHVWAEFMLPTGEWIPADPNQGDEQKNKTDFYFGNLENRRLALCKSFQINLPQARAGNNNVDILQFGAWWWTTSEKITGQLPSAQYLIQGKPAK